MPPMAPNAPSHKPADPILFSFASGDELSKGLADFVIKVGRMTRWLWLWRCGAWMCGLTLLRLHADNRRKMRQSDEGTSLHWPPRGEASPRCWQST